MLRVCEICMLALTCASVGLPQHPSDPIPIARKALDLLLSAQYHELREMFDGQMLQAVSEQMLRNQIGPIVHNLGKAESIGNPSAQHVQSIDVIIFPVHFANGDLKIILPVDNSGKIAGLRFSPGEPAGKAATNWSPPPYVNESAFHNRDVTVGAGEWKLPGTFSIPNGTGPFPAIVLVQGSGPEDRDETVGANKPFRDLAEGLASHGIAVLRYEKRTSVYGQKMAAEVKDLTVDQETIDDALDALALLRSQAEIDHKRIFVLGHSLGGYLGPRIAERDPQLAGLIIMAGTTRALEDVMLEQYEYLGASAGEIEKLKQQIAEIHSLRSPEGPTILNAPRSYWLDLNQYDPKLTIQKLHCRVLVMQGGRDYQVTQADYRGWQMALSGSANATFHLYPALNHLFIAGEGKSLPAEYDKPGHVAPEVINDIASWVEK